MNWLSTLLGNLNYGTIFLLMLLESTVIPVPSEFVVSPAAYHAAGGNLDIWLVILFSTLGADCGATINYLAGHFLGRPIIYRFANSKWGKMCLLNQHKVEKSEKYFCRISKNEILAIPSLHNNRCRSMELHPCSSRLVSAFCCTRRSTQR